MGRVPDDITALKRIVTHRLSRGSTSDSCQSLNLSSPYRFSNACILSIVPVSAANRSSSAADQYGASGATSPRSSRRESVGLRLPFGTSTWSRISAGLKPRSGCSARNARFLCAFESGLKTNQPKIHPHLGRRTAPGVTPTECAG